MADSTVNADIKQNRLYIKVGENPNKRDFFAIYTDIRFAVAELKPGFDVISDLSDCNLAALSAIPTYIKITSYLVDNNAGQIVRVLNKDSLLFKQAFNFAIKRAGYKADYVSTVQEAEDKLTEFVKRDGLRFSLIDRTIEFCTDTARGEAKLLDISTSGCSIFSDIILPEVGENISIMFPFLKGDDPEGKLQVKASVVREGENSFAVHFSGLGEEMKTLMLEQLRQELKAA